MTKLNQANLDRIPVPTPGYDRTALRGGIVHFGLGNFHRAHQAVYLDRLMTLGQGQDFAIVGAGVMPSDARMRDVLAGQDYLYTVVEQSAEASQARVIGAMIDHLPAADGAAIVARLADPAIRRDLIPAFRELGFKFVTLDLEGFRSGSLNTLIPLDGLLKPAPIRKPAPAGDLAAT